jgi:hypothetical protein
MASRLALDLGFGRLQAGCRQATSAVIAFTNALLPLIGSLGAVAFLIWCDPLLTLMLFAGFMLWATLLYPVAMRASQGTIRSERADAEYREDVQQFLRSYDFDGRTRELASIDAFVRTYLEQRGLKYEIALVVQIGATVIVALAVIYIVWSLMSRGGDWPILVAYIVALRLALAGCSGAIAAFANVSRFYPRLMGYSLFMRNAAALDREVLGTLSPGEAVVLGKLPSGDLVVKGGDRLAVVTWDDDKEVEFALIRAQSVSTGRPLAVGWWDPTSKIDPPETSLLLIKAATLMEKEGAKGGCNEPLQTQVVLIVHRDLTKIGELGETGLIVISNRAITHFVSAVSAKQPEYLALLQTLERRSRRSKSDQYREDEEML